MACEICFLRVTSSAQAGVRARLCDECWDDQRAGRLLIENGMAGPEIFACRECDGLPARRRANGSWHRVCHACEGTNKARIERWKQGRDQARVAETVAKLMGSDAALRARS